METARIIYNLRKPVKLMTDKRKIKNGSSKRGDEFIPIFKRAFNLDDVAFAFVAVFFAKLAGQRLEQPERDIHGLKILRLDRRNVSAESSHRRSLRGIEQRSSGERPSGIHAGEPTGRDGFDVAFDARDLPREKDV